MDWKQMKVASTIPVRGKCHTSQENRETEDGKFACWTSLVPPYLSLATLHTPSYHLLWRLYQKNKRDNRWHQWKSNNFAKRYGNHSSLISTNCTRTSAPLPPRSASWRFLPTNILSSVSSTRCDAKSTSRSTETEGDVECCQHVIGREKQNYQQHSV